jgi:hypothetical protein
MSDTVLLIGLAIFASMFVAWWFMTLPNYRAMARDRVARDQWSNYLRQLPRAAEYATTDSGRTPVYAARRFKGDRFPGSVPALFSSMLTQPSRVDDMVYGMPRFAPRGKPQPA